MSRYESLSAADYHLGTLYVPAINSTAPTTRSAFETLSGGLWDVGVNATRIFSSAASVRSGTGSTENAIVSPTLRPVNATKGLPPKPVEFNPSAKASAEIIPSARTPGLKIFIQSPYDCVLALKRDLSDHLSFLIDHAKYKEAWELVNEHPEAITAGGDDFSLDDAQSTPTKQSRQSLRDFFADDAASQTTVSVSKVRKGVVEGEQRRIGEMWLQELVSAKDWAAAGEVAGRVLGDSPRWEHWVWTFAQTGRFDEITPYIPTKQLYPPLPSVVYERVLGHYINRDRPRFKELIDAWDADLFHIGSITSAIEKKLENGEIREDTVEDGVQGRDWRILLETLAKLNLADSRPKDALRCYIQLQNSDAAMALIGEYHLVEAVADDIPGFLTLRVSKEQLSSAPLAEFEEASSDAIRLVVDESLTGVVKPQVVVEQLQARGALYRPFLFLYLKSLWECHTAEFRPHRIHQQLESEGRQYVEQYGDLAVSLFAEYNRELLMKFLKASRSYSYEKASAICEQKGFYPELVHLLSMTGQTKKALSLIINSLGDVKFAINFVKEQNDPELWDDLLEFSMDKPRFIRGLLEEVGTAIDPIKLVRRIPEGLEIEGLREGIGRMLREYEIQGSISEGVARVLRGEVATGMESLRHGRARAIKFAVEPEKEDQPQSGEAEKSNEKAEVNIAPEQEDTTIHVESGHCLQCRNPFRLGGK
jgi:vacuolar protein sorting-associated protein 41